MADEQTPPGEAKKMSEHLAANVKRLREHLRIPATEFAERLAALGATFGRMGVQRLERGERRVEIDEIAALAKVLEVPPLLLFLPVGIEAKTEVLPGYVRDTWDAAKWFTGEAPLSTEPQYREDGAFHAFTQSSEDFNAWHRGGRPLEMAREHERLLMNWRIAVLTTLGDLANVAEGSGATPEARKASEEIAAESVREARLLERALLDHRRAMAREGMLVPEVPELFSEHRERLAAFGLLRPTRKSAPVDGGWIDGDEETDG